jgi:fatty acid desaturase
VSEATAHIPHRWDPEPRWPAWIAILAVGGLYTALPPYLIIGPRWLFLVIVLVLMLPIVAFQRSSHPQSRVGLRSRAW